MAFRVEVARRFPRAVVAGLTMSEQTACGKILACGATVIQDFMRGRMMFKRSGDEPELCRAAVDGMNGIRFTAQWK
jgi:hypothetical protein